MAEPNDRSRWAAAFLAQALDLADEPAVLAPDLALVDADPALAVFAAELESSIGPAAFLIYAYELAAVDSEGRSGEARFAADLETLERAASLGAPGPRAVAHARDGENGYILATSPATLRALAGEDAASTVDPAAAVPPPSRDAAETRGAAAAELLRLLHAANEQAVAWAGAMAADDPVAAFTPEETELALFLLDEGSIQPLLAALDALLTTARAQTGRGSDRPAG